MQCTSITTQVNVVTSRVSPRLAEHEASASQPYLDTSPQFMHLSVHNGRYSLHVHVCRHVVLFWDVHESILIKSEVDNGPIQLKWVMKERVARSAC